MAAQLTQAAVEEMDQAARVVHTKPFNLEHAKAGAPFCRADGTEYEIVKWDRKHTQQLVAVSKQDAAIHTFRADGSPPAGGPDMALVMRSIGYIDNKPLFFGDELITATGERIIVSMEHLCRKEGERSLLVDCCWPVPAKVYPETRMHWQDLIASAMQASILPMQVTGSQVTAMANAALRHAIDAGQVVLPGAAMRDDDIMAAFSKVCAEEGYSPSLLVQQSVVKAVQSLLVTEPEVEQLKADAKRASMELGKAERLLESHGYRSVGNGEWQRGASPVKCFYGHPKKGLYVEGDKASIDKVTAIVARGDARDMAVAQAATMAMYNEIYRLPGRRAYHQIVIDLAAVIARVPS